MTASISSLLRLGSSDDAYQASVSSRSQEIRVTHTGNPGALEKIIDIVRRLGYEARLRRDTV